MLARVGGVAVVVALVIAMPPWAAAVSSSSSGVSRSASASAAGGMPRRALLRSRVPTQRASPRQSSPSFAAARHLRHHPLVSTSTGARASPVGAMAKIYPSSMDATFVGSFPLVEGGNLSDVGSLSHAVDVRHDTVSDVRDLDTLMEAVMPLVRQYRLGNSLPDEHKVVEHMMPWELLEQLDGLHRGLPDEGTDLDTIVECIKKTIAYSVRTGHPRYFDKLCHGSESVGQVAEFVTSVLNTNV